MGTCLVTTLKESVSDNTLIKLGELKVHIKQSPDLLCLWLSHDNTITLTVTSPCYFTNSSGTSNLGTSITLYGQVYDEILYVKSNQGDGDLVISNKYVLNRLGFFVNNTGNARSNEYKLYLNDLLGVNAFKNYDGGGSATIGTTKDISGLPSIAVFQLDISSKGTPFAGDIAEIDAPTLKILRFVKCSSVKGDIGVLTNRSRFPVLERIDMEGDYAITGNISSFADKPFVNILIKGTGVTGNVSSMTDMTSLLNLNISGTSITGTLSSLATNSPSLKILDVSDTSITGDTSDLAGLTNLTTFTYTNTAITGTWPLV